MIEQVIRRVGVDPETARGQKEGQWNLKKGTSPVWVDLWFLDGETRLFFQVMSPVVPLPVVELRAAFCEDLLRLNDKLFASTFTLRDGHAWIKSIREADGLDASEAELTIRRIGYYGEKYRQLLQEKYAPEAGATPGPPVPPA